MRVVQQMCDIPAVPREIIVDAQNFMALFQKIVTQMTPKETGASGYKNLSGHQPVFTCHIHSRFGPGFSNTDSGQFRPASDLAVLVLVF
jgi:hypothetical protein